MNPSVSLSFLELFSNCSLNRIGRREEWNLNRVSDLGTNKAKSLKIFRVCKKGT